MMSATTPCYPNVSQGLPICGVSDDNVVSCSPEGISGSETFPNSLLLSLSLLKEKVHQVQSMVNIFLSPHLNQNSESTSIAVASMNTLIQEIIFTASSMTSSFQQMAMVTGSTPSITKFDDLGERGQGLGLEFHTGETLEYWYGNNNSNTCNMNSNFFNINLSKNNDNSRGFPPKNDDIIELDAAYLLAKYTHYCQVCGKGFKRAANLRMHMRAHGDEYKSSAALSNPKKNESEIGQKDSHAIKMPKKYSCPQEGCRWNRKHDKFQPLKSIICVKNHYKRSHCAKLYVCKRCNRKQFSVLSDLRTHEKHCGVVKWQCSCGTTFSRKDKLMGHVALFVGHTPAVNSLKKNGTS